MKKIRNYLKKEKILFIILFALYISSICFWYDDTNSNITHSINIWKALFSGDFFHFYSYNIESFNLGLTNHKGGYEVFLYMVVAVWQFPLFIIEKVSGEGIIGTFFARAWAKLFFVLMIYLCCVQLRKMCLNLKLSERVSYIISILFCCSSFVITSACVISQIDIVGLLFILISFNYFLKDDKVRFLIFFSMATLCKSFSLFIFIPLILLKEKKIRRILAYCLIPIVTMYILNLPFSLFDPEGVLCKIEPTSTLIYGLLLSRISLFGRSIPIIFLAYAFLGIFCYLKDIDKEDEDMKKYWYVYIGAIASLIFTLMVESPYRNVYIVPFFLVLFFYNRNNQRRRLFVYTIANLSFTVALLIRFPYCSDYQFMRGMFVDCVLPLRKFELFGLEQFSSYMTAPEMNDIWLFLYAVFIAWSIGFIVMNHPNKITITKEKFDSELNGRDISIYSFVNYCISNISIIIFAVMVIRNILLKF